MSQVVRYFHIRPNMAHKGGATVRVVGDTELVGQVDVQVAKCSKHDSFVKAIGRAEAAAAPVKIIPLRFLPRELERLDKYADWLGKDYNFSIKYFLPKE